MVTGWAERDEIIDMVCLPIVAILAGYIAEFSKRSNVMDVMGAIFSLHRTALATYMSISSPGRIATIGRQTISIISWQSNATYPLSCIREGWHARFFYERFQQL